MLGGHASSSGGRSLTLAYCEGAIGTRSSVVPPVGASSLDLGPVPAHVFLLLGRVLINRQPNANLDAPPNFRCWG